MNILVHRTMKLPQYTIGKLYIDNKYICDTLEDADRGLMQGDPLWHIRDIKIFGKTAIPLGTYNITMDIVSQKFKNRGWAKPFGGKLPRLLNVPGYEGVLIHVGNKPEDTLGCILVGYNKIKGQVINSTQAFNEVMKHLLTATDNITITIK